MSLVAAVRRCFQIELKKGYGYNEFRVSDSRTPTSLLLGCIHTHG